MRQQTLKSMHLAAVLRSPGSHKPNDGVIPEAVPTSDWQIWRGKAGGAIFPCDEWKMLGWDRVLLLLIAYYAFCAPFRTCMDVVASGGWRLFELFGDLFFNRQARSKAPTGIYIAVPYRTAIELSRCLRQSAFSCE